MGKTYAVVLSLVLSLVVACQSVETPETTGSARLGGTLPSSVTLLTWNTQKLHDPKIEEDLSSLVRQHSPDLVFLQEVNIGRLTIEQMGGHFAEAWSYPWPGGASVGVVTLSHLWPKQSRPVQTGWREFFVTTPKVSLITEYPLQNGRTLLAVNVHLLNFETWDPFMLRAQLQDLETEVAKHEGPVIMAGDFNTWNQARLTLVSEMADRLQLAEITGFSKGRKTGDLNSDVLHWMFGVQPELPLDRVYSRGFEAASVEVLPADSSDHRPVLVTLDLDTYWTGSSKRRVAFCSGILRAPNVRC